MVFANGDIYDGSVSTSNRIARRSKSSGSGSEYSLTSMTSSESPASAAAAAEVDDDEAICFPFAVFVVAS